MTSRPQIPIPLIQRWHRFRQQALPIICFFACCIFTLWLWQRQARIGNAFGEVHADRVVLTSSTDGFIDTRMSPKPTGEYWSKFDVVQQDQIITRLDDRPLQLAMERASAEIVRLRRQVDADRAKFQYDHWDHLHNSQRELARLTWQAFDRRLESLDRQIDVFDRQTTIATLKVQLQTVQNRIKYWEPLVKRNQPVITQFQLEQEMLLQNSIVEQINQSRIALQESLAGMELANQQKADLDGQLVSFTNESVELPAFDVLVAPLLQSIVVQEKTIEELNLKIQSLDVRTPISGTIAEVHVMPGQPVRAGDPIVTVASDDGQYLESYIRQQQLIDPYVGMKVRLRARRSGSAIVDSEIDRVGAQMEMVPPHQQVDPALPEWGLPVRIPVPPTLNVRPGEIVDILFPPKNVREANRVAGQLR